MALSQEELGGIHSFYMQGTINPGQYADLMNEKYTLSDYIKSLPANTEKPKQVSRKPSPLDFTNPFFEAGEAIGKPILETIEKIGEPILKPVVNVLEKINTEQLSDILDPTALAGGIIAGPAGYKIGKGVSDVTMPDFKNPVSQGPAGQLAIPGQTGQTTVPEGILGGPRQEILSREEQASQALKELQNIISPTFQTAQDDISSLLGSARQELGGFQGQGVQQKLLSDILSGDKQITDLPQYAAQAQALQNALGYTGQTQSPTGTAFAFQPLISDIFGQIQSGAREERAQDIGLSKSIADLFRSEGLSKAELGVKELGTKADIAQLMGSQMRGFAQQLANLGIQEENFRRGGLASDRLIKQQEAAAEGQAIAETIKLAFENKDELIDMFKGVTDFFTGGGTPDFEHY